MDYEVSSGGIILKENKLVLVCDSRTQLWGFPKGHVEYGESLEETAVREIFEETGIRDLTLIERLGEYTHNVLSRPFSKKRITLYKFQTTEYRLQPINSEVTPIWVLINDAENILSYDEDKSFFLKNKHKLNGS